TDRDAGAGASPAGRHGGNTRRAGLRGRVRTVPRRDPHLRRDASAALRRNHFGIRQRRAVRRAADGACHGAPRGGRVSVGTYRAGIVGLSWISADPAGPATHPVLGTAIPFSHASAYAATPGIEVVAACDIDQAASETFRERWNYRWPGMHLYADYREMLQQEQIDFLSVVTPDHLHAEVILAAVEAGVRAIFAEKPLATSLEDADR